MIGCVVSPEGDVAVQFLMIVHAVKQKNLVDLLSPPAIGQSPVVIFLNNGSVVAKVQYSLLLILWCPFAAPSFAEFCRGLLLWRVLSRFKIFRVPAASVIGGDGADSWFLQHFHSPHQQLPWLLVSCVGRYGGLFVVMRMVLRLVESSYVIVVDTFAGGGYWDCLAVELCCRSAVPVIR
ncbi:hypothetical protein Nepgr_005211 [Nepenthes gracilis]|uniref:Uncharacterized protein n=1 Tax=Nepenthes gracilis TaxID=150966 RepID=A0AAD3XG76_NEPGR|nr:hypothetical protein Nepgr_005211 [Nepenthes gracilis]